ncbi:GntR family transcriptional regulator [Paraburkholderia madseniana]|jgi:DNA-binding GntR family transcriptional regulator|uniref:GntR family transcriptional regulator n=1 Tax=Paraburkholderia madseniana TaxID=2599607 RepID=A0AAP5B811_9BURK|nr:MULTISPECIES: GntR family transcriptional regulator [Paraburkholderia]MCX4144591.1 GntR family transcriptional regulator [Paraburkholderia madseniana]MDN7147543.1 GntR family transcriptional regulator [Paraburkholderia sp. WS6]MDQ6406423.1 GntR family transcriptional regulator [Paraburkholderia madseniana]
MPPVAAKRRTKEASTISEVVADESTRKIVRPTTVELVTTAVRQRILSGDLAPGEALRQEALAEELGVSRVPIREAITRLTAEGLLTNVPHKGAYVSELSIDEVRETFDIRLRLEPWIFSEAIPRISEAEMGKAERLVKEMDKADSGVWGQLNWRLHETLYLPAQRDITLQMLRVLHDRCDRYFRFQAVQVPIREQSHDEHMGLVQACRKRDAKLGAKLLEQHVKTAAQQIMSVVDAVVTR